VTRLTTVRHIGVTSYFAAAPTRPGQARKLHQHLSNCLSNPLLHGPNTLLFHIDPSSTMSATKSVRLYKGGCSGYKFMASVHSHDHFM
jgi:hypothetical protein